MLTNTLKNIFCFILFGVLFRSYVVAGSNDMHSKIHGIIPQDCACFLENAIKSNEPIVPYDTAQVMESFLTYYFLPWKDPFHFLNVRELLEKEKKELEECFQMPGWGTNRQQYTADFFKEISSNMALDTFPNCQQPAIVVHTTHLRKLPYKGPSFTCFKYDENSHLFDNWQESLLFSNEPVYVLHMSQDNTWSFVVTGSYNCGWVLRNDIAYVKPAFMAQWKTGEYVTPLRDNVPIVGNTLTPFAKVGQLIPLAQQQKKMTDNYQILTVFKDSEGYATVKECTIGKEDIVIMPLLATPNNVVRIANNLIGQPYDWGGTQGYRDCSSTLKDLFTPFGIWLPRDSGPQSSAGTFVSLEGLKNDEKEKVIKEQGTPFFSLIWMPGHIALYVGAKKGVVYIYNNIWGMSTHSPSGKKGRAVIGKVVIMPLNFGKEYRDIEHSLLDRSKGLILMNNRLFDPHEELSLFKK